MGRADICSISTLIIIMKRDGSVLFSMSLLRSTLALHRIRLLITKKRA